jgi:glycosidase
MAGRNQEYLRGLLRGLYGEQEADFLSSEIGRRIEACRPLLDIRSAGMEKLTERDVMLISYPDQVSEAGVCPLTTLAEFCHRHFRGVLRGVHILPFFPSSSDDGFSVIDYRHVDPTLGTWEDIFRLGADFRLMFDAVINHTSVRNAWFQGFLRGEAPYRDFYIHVSPSSDLSGVARPRTSPLTHRFDAIPQEKNAWTTFSSDQVDLNYRNPAVLLEIVDLLLFYAAQGAEFIRLDAVAYLWKESGTSCLNLPQTHRLVQVLRTVIDEAAPGVKLVTETNVAHTENIRYLGDGTNEAHLVYNFALPPMILHTLRTGDHGRLTQWVNSLALPGRQSMLLNFLASHDGIGLGAVRDLLPETDIQELVRQTLDHGGRISFRRTETGRELPYELNINYFDALSDPQGGEPLEVQIGRFLAAHAILLSLSGLPAVYFHSLIGSRGWNQGVEQTGRNRSINRQKFVRAVLENELSETAGLRSRVLEGLNRLIRARMSSPAFDPYGTQRSLHGAGGVFSLLRVAPQGGERVLCVQNVTARVQTLDLDFESVFGAHSPSPWITDMITGKRHHLRRKKTLRLAPYQGCWFHCPKNPRTHTERIRPA